MRRLGHPGMKRLLRWIEGGEPRLDDHLRTCTYCAGRLEPLLDDGDEALRRALLEVLTMPAEVPQRLQRAIDERLSARDDLTLVSELFGLPIRAVRVMSARPEGDR